jgi:hypothetical protein
VQRAACRMRVTRFQHRRLSGTPLARVGSVEEVNDELLRVSARIRVPSASTKRRSGSVSVFEPAPLENTAEESISWNASERGTKTSSVMFREPSDDTFTQEPRRPRRKGRRELSSLFKHEPLRS